MFTGRSVRLAVNSRAWNPTQTEWQLAAQCVQVEEKDRIGKFVFKKDAKSAMVGRLLMRYGVSNVLGVPFRALNFSRTDKGKPYLTSPVDRGSPRCDVSFNISHQGDFVVFAAERGRLVGVDVMNVEWPRSKPVSEFFNTLDRQLTANEWTEVRKRSGEMQQLKCFYRLWCLKESLVKALGIGIGFEVNRLDFKFGTPDLTEGHMCGDTSVDIDGQAGSEWSFQETMLGDHCVAVAVQDACRNNADVMGDDPGQVKDGDLGLSGDDLHLPPFHVIDIEDLLTGCDPLLGSSPDIEYWEKFSSREEAPGVR